MNLNHLALQGTGDLTLYKRSNQTNQTIALAPSLETVHEWMHVNRQNLNT